MAEKQFHGATGGRRGQKAEEPSLAEKARTLVHLATAGTLSTLSALHEGWPFGSLMPYSLDWLGQPIFLISSMAVHTQNLVADPRASLLVTEATAGDPLGAGRVTLLGRVRLAETEAEKNLCRESYLSRHPNSRFWVDYADFDFYLMEVAEVYMVAGFGSMGWLTVAEYHQAEPDPLADYAAEIINHMNIDHQDSLRVLARAATSAEISDAAMTGLDRLGFHVRVRTSRGVRLLRLTFPEEVRTVDAVRKVLIEMVRSAHREEQETS